VGAGTGAERGGADAPSRSTIETTDPATMATTTVPTATSRAGRRRHLGRAGGAGGWAGGARSPTQTPNGGGRSGIPPAGDHNRDMTLPRPGQLPRLPELSSGGASTAHPETYLVRPGHRAGSRPGRR
jgi:hypothetical protein